MEQPTEPSTFPAVAPRSPDGRTEPGDPARRPCELLLGGGWLITVDAERRVFRTGAVAVVRGRIADVGDARELEARWAPATRIDTSDRVVIPGLVNAHRHVLGTPKGAQPEARETIDVLQRFVYPGFAALGEEDLHTYALHAAAEMLRFGTTTFEEPGCTHLPAVLEALDRSGIRARIGPWTWDQLGPTTARLPAWERRSTKDCVRHLEQGIATVRAFGRPRIRDAVTMEGIGTASDELMIEAANLAAEAGSLFVLHKASSEREVASELAAFGHRPVEHMAAIGALNEVTLLNHATSLDDFEVPLIAASGAAISQNPSSALKLAKGTTITGKWPELVAAGVPVALGTDGENASNHQDICRAMYLAALLPRDARRDGNAMAAETALEMGTRAGADALHLADVTGAIEVGRAADITVFGTDDFDWQPLHNPVANLVYGATGHSVEMVLVDGEVLVEHGRSTRLDEGALREDMQRINTRVLAELGVEPSPSWPVI